MRTDNTENFRKNKRILAAIQAEEEDDLNGSLQHYKEALSEFQSDQYIAGEIFVLDSMGYIYELKDDMENALNCYRNGLTLKENNGDLDGEGRSYFSLGILFRNMGKIDAAEESLQKAYLRFQDSSDNYSRIICTLFYTEVLLQMRKFGTANDLLREIKEDIEKEQNIVLQISFLIASSTYLYEAHKDELLSIQLSQEAVVLAGEIDDNVTLATALIHHGELLLKLRNEEEARDCLNKALNLLREYDLEYLKSRAKLALQEIGKSSTNTKRTNSGI